jgi:alanine dehydrogenase
VQRLAAGNEWRQFEPLPRGIDLGGDGLVHPAVKGMA